MEPSSQDHEDVSSNSINVKERKLTSDDPEHLSHKRFILSDPGGCKNAFCPLSFAAVARTEAAAEHGISSEASEDDQTMMNAKTRLQGTRT